MILDITRIIVKSDLQPSNLTLEDATCMELEERLYDRLHAECSCQVRKTYQNKRQYLSRKQKMKIQKFLFNIFCKPVSRTQQFFFSSIVIK